MSRQLPLQLLLLLLLSLLLLLHTHTYVFSKPIAASLLLEGDFLPDDKGIVLGVTDQELLGNNILPKDNIVENCLSSCLGQLQPDDGDAGQREHQCGGRSGGRGDNQRWELEPLYFGVKDSFLELTTLFLSQPPFLGTDHPLF